MYGQYRTLIQSKFCFTQFTQAKHSVLHK